MRWSFRIPTTLLIFTTFATLYASESKIEIYPLTENSFRHDGVPRGSVERFRIEGSEIYGNNTRRDYWVYTPAQYDASQPAALMVFLDGWIYLDEEGKFKTSIVLDNLIHQGKIPITVAVFVNPANLRSIPTPIVFANGNTAK